MLRTILTVEPMFPKEIQGPIMVFVLPRIHKVSLFLDVNVI